MLSMGSSTVHLSCRAIQNSQRHDASFAGESCGGGGGREGGGGGGGDLPVEGEHDIVVLIVKVLMESLRKLDQNV